MKERIKVKPLPDDDIRQSIRMACSIAMATRERVEFEANDHYITIAPDQSFASVWALYKEMIEITGRKIV